MGLGQVDPQPLLMCVRVRPHRVTRTPGPAPRVLAQPVIIIIIIVIIIVIIIMTWRVEAPH